MALKTLQNIALLSIVALKSPGHGSVEHHCAENIAKHGMFEHQSTENIAKHGMFGHRRTENSLAVRFLSSKFESISLSASGLCYLIHCEKLVGSCHRANDKPASWNYHPKLISIHYLLLS